MPEDLDFLHPPEVGNTLDPNLTDDPGPLLTTRGGAAEGICLSSGCAGIRILRTDRPTGVSPSPPICGKLQFDIRFEIPVIPGCDVPVDKPNRGDTFRARKSYARGLPGIHSVARRDVYVCG